MLLWKRVEIERKESGKGRCGHVIYTVTRITTGSEERMTVC